MVLGMGGAKKRPKMGSGKLSVKEDTLLADILSQIDEVHMIKLWRLCLFFYMLNFLCNETRESKIQLLMSYRQSLSLGWCL